MYFPRSEAIASDHPELTAAVEAVDEFIYTIGSYPIRPDQVADNLQLPLPILERILRLYAGGQILREETRRYCAQCDLLVEDDENGGSCDNCETEFSRRRPLEIKVFVLIDPIVRVEPESDDNGGIDTPVMVQFIAGDRGGGQHSQLQTPKEFKKIQDALKAGEHRDRFRMASPIFAATAQDIGAAYESRPSILHFGGHGDERSLSVIVDKTLLAHATPLAGDQLVKILESFPNRVRLCLLNTCESRLVAVELANKGVVDAAIGWHGKVPDAVAIAFAEGFYKHVANGLSVAQAFTLASECSGATVAGARTELFPREGVKPRQCFLVNG